MREKHGPTEMKATHRPQRRGLQHAVGAEQFDADRTAGKGPKRLPPKRLDARPGSTRSSDDKQSPSRRVRSETAK